MAKCSCPIFTTGFFMFICGGGYVAVLVLFWNEFIRGSTQKINWFRASNASSAANIDSTIEEILSGWILPGTMLTAAITVLTGFLGIISACRQGQCEVLSYLVLSISTAILNVCLLVVTSVVVAAHCHESVKTCMESKERDYYIALFSIIGGTFYVFIMSIFGSWASCKETCYCCGAKDRDYDLDYRSRTNSYAMGTINPYYY